MRYSRASIARGVAVVLAAGATAGCSMIGELELRGPVLPGTLFMILALLVGIFAVAGVRYASRASASESGTDRGSDNVT
jgi:hypothetical protein